MARAARELRISGSVQGVGFRWTSKRLAEDLELAGWVRNNPDGSVSIALEGGATQMDEFLERLRENLGGHIAAVQSCDVPPGKYRDSFDVRH